jgi:peptidyl-prolyl cis-trans isomerase C
MVRCKGNLFFNFEGSHSQKMNKNKNISKCLLITILGIFIFLNFNPILILADEQTSPSETNTDTTETILPSEEKTETILPPETILSSFDGQTITLGEFNQLWDQIPENSKLQLTKRNVLDQIISEKLLIQEAKNRGLEQDKDVLEQIKNTTEQILVQSLIEKEIIGKVKVDDQEALTYYEENKDNFITKEQVYLYNILVETEEVAKDILEKLKAGGDFIEIAKEKSTGPSAAQGGDLGYVSKGDLIPEIENVVFALEIGNISDIIKSEYGFHILKVTDKKPEALKTFEEVKEEITKTLLSTKQKEAFNNLLEELKSQVTIEINEEALQ